MRILQVIPYFAKEKGGEVNVCSNLSTQLVQRGHSVTIATTDFELDQGLVDAVKNLGVDIIPFHCTTNVAMLLLSPEMRKWLTRNINVFDVIHLHTSRSHQNALVHRYAKKLGVPYVLQPHGSFLTSESEKPVLKKLYDWVWGDKIFSDACKLIAVSNAEVTPYFLKKVDSSRICVIPNGVDVGRYKDLPERGQFRRQHGISAPTRLILNLGRLHRTKGIDFLVAAFEKVAQEEPDAMLIIAGPDEGYRNDARRLVKNRGLQDRVLFFGFIDDPRAAYVDADVVVYPTQHEVFGLVVFEAIMCGTPVIVTEGCGCGELVKGGEFGSLVHFGDINQLKNAIVQVIRDPTKGREMVEIGKTFVQKNLAWDKVVGDVERVYEYCIHHSASLQ